MILLADADILVYQAASKNQEGYKWGEEVDSLYVAPIEDAIATLDNDIANLLKVTKTPELLLTFSSSPNFRYEVLLTYKHNRKDTPKPIHLQELREYALATYPSKVKPKLEGDDVMGILATKHPNKYLIASIDKDMKQIPGKHYNWNTREFFEVNEHQGDLWFFQQILTGDPGDGYKGCPGIGKAKAEKIIKTVLDEHTPWANQEELNVALWRSIVKQYMLKGLHEEDALQQARVARILRATDYDFKKKEPILWKP